MRLPPVGTEVVEYPQHIQRAIDAIVSLVRGGAPDLSAIELDLDAVPEFNRRVYEITRAIPRGTTLSYGEIAKQLGDIGLSRAVGQALGQNPIPIIVPCHRVLGADGRLVGFSATGGVETKRRLLAIEGAMRDLFTP